MIRYDVIITGPVGAGKTNRHFLEHRSLWELARIVVYTADHTPEEVRDEILERLVPMPSRGREG